MNRIFTLFLILALLFITTACTRQKEPAEQANTFQGVGMVIAVDRENGTITIDHEEIPGLMAAMTMRFPVKDKNILTGIQPDDEINFTLTQTDSETFVSEIRKSK